MKNLKRLIALVAVFAMALTTIASAASFSDVAEDSAYYEGVETLSKLGIIDGYEDGSFKPEQTVTRAEMAKLLACIQGYGSSAEAQTSTVFTDVPAEHWASGYIANATGIAIDGYGDGTFRPDVQVKYEEAVKMIMATLGYTVIANGKGGYPMGYVSAAISAKVTDGVSNATVGTNANRGTIAQLLFNAIDTPLVEQTTWEKDGSGEYTKFDGTGNNAYKTLMSEYLDVVKMKGVVVANSYMNIKETVSTIDKDDDPTVKIDITNTYKVINDEFYDGYDYAQGYEFLVGDSDAEDFVGKAVIFFAKENDYDDWEIISIAEDSTYNTSVTFPLADFDKDDSTADSIYYYKNDSSTGTKLKLEEDVNVLYNNAYYSGNLVRLIADLADGNFGGQVTLVDTNKTSGYDLAIIEAAVSAVVDEVNGKKITLKDTVSLPAGGTVSKINTDDDDVIVVLTKDGKEISASDINEDDVLSIVSVRNAVYTVVDVMSNIIEGTVSSRKASSTSSDGYAYKIDGTWYDVAAGADIGNVAAGDAGNFYIDKYGYIAYYDETVAGSTGTYGYIIDALVDEDSWGNKTFEVKMLTSEGVKTYQAADKFTVYTANGTKLSLKVDDLDTSYDDEFLGEYGDTVVDYGLSSGKLSKFVVAGYDDKFNAVGAVSGTYDASSYEIGRTSFEKDTIVFYVDSNSDSKCYVGTLADLEDDEIISSNNAGYAYENSKNSEDANILVLYDMGTSASASSGLAVITEIEDGSDEDGDDIYVLTVLYNGEEVELNTDADVYTDIHGDITVGDIVKLKVNSNNVITALTLVYDFDEDVRGKYTALDVEDKYVYANSSLESFDGGYASAYSKTGKKVTLFNGHQYKLSDCDNIYVIDNTGRKIDFYVGSAADFYFDSNLIEDGDWTTAEVTLDNGDTVDPDAVADIVIFRVYDNDTVEAVIIKGIDSADYDVE